MIIDFEDNEYELDWDEVDLKQATTIFKKYGMTILALQKALDDKHPDALRAAYWVMLAQNGQHTNIDNLNCKIIKFAKAYDAGLLEAARAEIEAKKAELEAKRDEGEELTPDELGFLAAVEKAGLAVPPKVKAKPETSSPA